ncbi:MAG: organic solvent ABC transporter ATP-binding protein [Betaproteobacteria bacterium]|nr:organic solvent ABC transporter ATP-binding protein [Betaproteobacteria bacterium]
MESATIDPSAAATPMLSASGMQVGARGAVPALALDFVLCAGELQLIHSRHKERSSDIADVLLGLADAGSGIVRFLGRAWHELSRHEAFELRRAIARVQGRGNWMEGRSVMDNLLLPVRHHTILPEHALRSRASVLARQFGLPGLPLLLPSDCAPGDLERAACVRAFLGRPALLVLEHPMAFEDSDLLLPLMNAIQQMRRRGGSVIWFTEHGLHAMEASLTADRHCELVDAHLIDLKLNRR